MLLSALGLGNVKETCFSSAWSCLQADGGKDGNTARQLQSFNLIFYKERIILGFHAQGNKYIVTHVQFEIK